MKIIQQIHSTKNQLPKATSLPVFATVSTRYFHLFIVLISFAFIFSSCQKEEMIKSLPDATLPSVIGIDPDNEESNVPLDKSITITFDQQLDVSRFMVNLTLQKDNVMVSGNISFNGHQVNFTPDTTLDPESEYTILVNITDNISGARTSERHYASVFYTMP